ncbi:hypothetical protein D2962_14200 [Biomaibacter acetigenes]|uniref:Uncharacterized protein n=1 Tax=Biomaibacter acetigenes TaxID=2316383 RepID=A0A3G2RA43_9FIRM|nr:hypothetical protein D2962_14200 [Biomaibacter acetigenes]
MLKKSAYSYSTLFQYLNHAIFTASFTGFPALQVIKKTPALPLTFYHKKLYTDIENFFTINYLYF